MNNRKINPIALIAVGALLMLLLLCYLTSKAIF